MKNRSFFLAIVIAAVTTSCNTSTNPQQQGKGVVVATDITSKSLVLRPDSMPDEDWKFIAASVENKKLIEDIVEQVKSGKVKAYDVFNDKEALTTEQVSSILVPPPDTVETEDLDNPGKMVRKIVSQEFSYDMINYIWFKEDWAYDKGSNSFTKMVKSIALATEVYNEDGTVRGTKVLFVIKNNL
jgi:hypothetical protein